MRLPNPFRTRAGLFLLLAGTLLAACSPAYVIVPDRRDGYSARDPLYGRLKGKDIRVTFRHDTTWRVDTVTKWRTIYRNGSRVDTVVVVDTVRTGGGRRPFQRVDTVVVVVHDTVRVTEPAGPRRPGVPGPNVQPRPPVTPRVDTVRIGVH